jgi:hypothetical protein
MMKSEMEIPKPVSRLYPLLRDASPEFIGIYEETYADLIERLDGKHDFQIKNILLAGIALRKEKIERMACQKIGPQTQTDIERNKLCAELCAYDKAASDLLDNLNQ